MVSHPHRETTAFFTIYFIFPPTLTRKPLKSYTFFSINSSIHPSIHRHAPTFISNNNTNPFQPRTPSPPLHQASSSKTHHGNQGNIIRRITQKGAIPTRLSLLQDPRRDRFRRQCPCLQGNLCPHELFPRRHQIHRP